MSENHNLTRRALLAGGAAAVSSAALASGMNGGRDAQPLTNAASDYELETPALVSALEDLAAARAACAQAETDTEWFVAEWEYHWPLAPEEILGGANAHAVYGNDTFIETDILGAPLFRNTADLTKRLSAEMRQKSPKLCFAIETPAELKRRIAFHRSLPARGRSPETRAKDAARTGRYVAGLERALARSERYLAERGDILERSGAALVLQRRRDARRAMADAFAAVERADAVTIWGLRAKALSYLAGNVLDTPSLQALGLSGGHALALNIAKATQPASGQEWPLITTALSDGIAYAAQVSA